jgi:hypothetical protein
MTESELHVLADLVAEKLASRLGSPAPWLTTRQAAEYAACSVAALHKAMARREVRFSQEAPGGKAYFRREWIEAWRNRASPLP